MSFAKKMYTQTDKIFNIQLGGIMEDIGYDADLSFRSKKTNQRHAKTFGVCSNSNELTILPYTKLDIGGFGKGWLIDNIARLIRNAGPKFFSINAGGDIYTTSDSSTPVSVLLENPFDTTQPIGCINLTSKALAASSPNRRRWKSPTDRKTYHHLLDRHGKNKRTMAAVFVVHPLAKIADAGATALSSAKLSEIKEISKTLCIQYLIVMPDGRYFKSHDFELQPD